MLGFSARAATTDICVDAEEIQFADWFTRDELKSKLEAGDVGLPGKTSIANRLIHAWLDGTLPI
jgi:NAD+ diphosphatase